MFKDTFLSPKLIAWLWKEYIKIYIIIVKQNITEFALSSVSIKLFFNHFNARTVFKRQIMKTKDGPRIVEFTSSHIEQVELKLAE